MDYDKYYKLLPLFSKSYTFKICEVDEIEMVLDFIKKHWKENHAFIKSRELLDWQQLDKVNNRYNFILAIHKETREIHALQGFILSSHFDPEISNPIRWPVMWKNRDDVGLPGLGLMVHWFAFANVPTNYYGSLGISDIAFPIYKKLDQTGVTTQWYILNPKMTAYSLVSNYEQCPKYNQIITNKSEKFINLSTDEYIALSGDVVDKIPEYKSKTYYLNRYLRHPIYEYKVTMIPDSEGKAEAIFFWRICEHNGSKCLRIVDYFGDYSSMEGHLTEFLLLIESEGAEFIDFINEGIDSEHFEKAGFINRNKTNLVLSNYFEPYHLKNIDFQYAYNSFDGKEHRPLFFKGDSDQDRPAIIED